VGQALISGMYSVKKLVKLRLSDDGHLQVIVSHCATFGGFWSNNYRVEFDSVEKFCALGILGLTL